MEWREEGYDNGFHFPIKVDGQYAVPDASSIKLTLRDNSGEVMTGYDRLSQPTTLMSWVSVTIPAAQNDIGSSSFETRYIKLEYTVNGEPFSIQKSYCLSAFLPIQVQLDDVRSLLGVSYEEMPTDEIDINTSYFILLAEHGTPFTTALTSGTVAAIYANKAIALDTAIRLLPALPAKLRQSEKQDNSEIIRMKVDFDKLRLHLESQRKEALDLALDRAEATGPTLIALTTPTDAITGA